MMTFNIKIRFKHDSPLYKYTRKGAPEQYQKQLFIKSTKVIS